MSLHCSRYLTPRKDHLHHHNRKTRDREPKSHPGRSRKGKGGIGGWRGEEEGGGGAAATASTAGGVRGGGYERRRRRDGRSRKRRRGREIDGYGKGSEGRRRWEEEAAAGGMGERRQGFRRGAGMALSSRI